MRVFECCLVIIGLVTTWQRIECFNLFGQDVWHPLAPLSPAHLIVPERTVMSLCKGNNSETFKEQNMESKCFETFNKKMMKYRKESTGRVNPKRECKLVEEFLECYKPVYMSMIQICGLSEADIADHESRLEAFVAGYKYLCIDNASRLSDFINGDGIKCTNAAREQIKESCNSTIPDPPPTYNKKNCLNAFEFQECLEDALLDNCENVAEETDYTKATIALLKSLLATNCWEYRPSWAETFIENEDDLPPKETSPEPEGEGEEPETPSANSQSDKSTLDTEPAASRTKDGKGGAGSVVPVWTLVVLCFSKLM